MELVDGQVNSVERQAHLVEDVAQELVLGRQRSAQLGGSGAQTLNNSAEFLRGSRTMSQPSANPA